MHETFASADDLAPSEFNARREYEATQRAVRRMGQSGSARGTIGRQLQGIWNDPDELAVLAADPVRVVTENAPKRLEAGAAKRAPDLGRAAAARLVHLAEGDVQPSPLESGAPDLEHTDERPRLPPEEIPGRARELVQTLGLDRFVSSSSGQGGGASAGPSASTSNAGPGAGGGGGFGVGTAVLAALAGLVLAVFTLMLGGGS